MRAPSPLSSCGREPQVVEPAEVLNGAHVPARSTNGVPRREERRRKTAECVVRHWPSTYQVVFARGLLKYAVSIDDEIFEPRHNA